MKQIIGVDSNNRVKKTLHESKLTLLLKKVRLLHRYYTQRYFLAIGTCQKSK